MKSIFLADDDPDDRMFFRDALRQVKIPTQLTISSDGMELMDNLETVTKPPPPDVIFLDLNMPGKNGFECLKEIKESPRLKKIPVVMFSTSSNQEMIDKSYQGGASYYLCKPRSFQQLVKAIEKVLGLDLWRPERTSREKFLLAFG